MKLTVDSVINEPRSVAITIDGYIPVDIKIIDSKKLPPLYWRGGDGKKNLLELAVLPENGFLSSITLVMIASDSIHKTDSLSVSLPSSECGVPVVNTKLWSHSESDDFSRRFVDDFSLDIEVIISSESMLLTIGENKKVTSWIKCSDNFYLGIDAGRNVVHLYLDKLTPSEVESFFEAVG
ncbi:MULTISPECIES: hypothetical protein [Enterobacteriaceae]|jgi:hypothetical protein|uniref:Uncharacterized protein n=3 Tax=Escherichia coli TaxID=562 RepID=A0A2A3ULE6_ECOLX|nr:MULTISPECIES: hypothetical protein [Enterobacteriaceae]7VMC_C Chain C, Contact-dependent inhibitor I [Escherichia coli O157:H7 str. EC869]EER0917500.1 hypothetical protein [Escherichia coli O168:H8]EES8554963.1 hypothetical protein [Escherichia coli O168]EEZ8572853.1 hypothetical protein [Escherichia coli O113]EFA4148348.1 hypothetical protein [Escherichia coli O99:H27]EHY1580271.1 hypothetical protein [Escherichia coli O8]EHY2166568.1 hypothetical protein [Escherichia coli O157]EJT27597